MHRHPIPESRRAGSTCDAIQPSPARWRGSKLHAFAALVTFSAPTWAYIDPNTGGWLYQLLFPVLVAIGAVWAGLRHQLRTWWDRLRGRKDEPAAPPEQSDRRD